MRGPVLVNATYKDPNRFTKLDSMWEVVDKRTVEYNRSMQNLEAKVERTPNAYRCAFPGCPIVATSKSGLRRCAGPCPADCKPAYCDKDCQPKCGAASLL